MSKSNKVTKADIVDKIYNAETNEIERQKILAVIDAFIGEVKTELMEGNIIELRGFGTFEPRLRKGREKARNPKTGAMCSVEPHFVAAFRAGQELKKALFDLKPEVDEK